MKSSRHELTVDASRRLDQFLAATELFSRSMAQKLVAQGHVQVNGTVIEKASYSLQPGDLVCVQQPAPVDHATVVGQEIPLNIWYEDESLLVVNKPAGMVVHPAAGNYDGTLVNALVHYLGDGLPAIGGVLRPGIVHRLDKDTSGLMLVAKTEVAHQRLVSMFAAKEIDRCYLALCHGSLDDSGVIEGNIGRDPKDRKRMAIVEADKGKTARTHYRLLEKFFCHQQWVSLIECRLDTGRTHQIRVHLRSVQRPLLGDQVYGVKKEPGYVSMRRQALHSASLCLQHPISGEVVELQCPLPEDMRDQVERLRRRSS
ncbi:RluA family pseudouridine synthase [Desulfurispirillum indicum]|uniref:RluA family pseudouridine synthase n=1 Tax=Desulfurispirillum indicum TaxID=936456 RepID=UPI001CFB0AF1|nr:RluA family pseudouridine synthase [Desulfurispirillum indicum]UCZ56321.1 RluA family pseudouridine synthase [Desulfurispirillum indicum]